MNGRHAACYRSATTVFLRGSPAINLGGFRFFGHALAPTLISCQLPHQILDIGSDLGGGLTVPTMHNWYAGFVCCDQNGASPVLQIMPFLRIGAVSGTTAVLNKAGEAVHTVVPESYSWPTKALTGGDCLLITENGKWSGRVTKILENSQTTIGLAEPGNLRPMDFVLPAPVGFDRYSYLTSFYVDAAEVRNIYDTGIHAGGYLVDLVSPSLNGSQPKSVPLDFRGYVAPLAVGVKFNITNTIVDVGKPFGNYLFHDASHQADTNFENAAPALIKSPMMVVYGSQGPVISYRNGGLAAAKSKTVIRPWGWVEP